MAARHAASPMIRRSDMRINSSAAPAAAVHRVAAAARRPENPFAVLSVAPRRVRGRSSVEAMQIGDYRPQIIVRRGTGWHDAIRDASANGLEDPLVGRAGRPEAGQI